MKIDVGLNHILEKIIPIDVDSIFPEEINQDVCYTEIGKQLLLEEIKEIQENLGWQLFYFLEMMGTVEPRKEEEDLSTNPVPQLIKRISSDPFADVKPHFSSEFQKLIDEAKRFHQSTYIQVVKILTELAWKHEVLGDNVLFLKNRLAETCSKLYLDLKSKELVAKVDSKGKVISEFTKDRRRRDAVMFGHSASPTHITLNVEEYADLGAVILMEALNLNFSIHHIALGRKDNIQAFRSFRKAVRIRKRFGLTKTMRNYLMDRDLFMTHNSMMQMGQKEDDLELRKFEVQKRTEQQIRNLKYKIIIIN